MYPEGHVQMALPLTGLVSQLEPSLQGLLMQASLRWHSRPGQGGGSQWALPPAWEPTAGVTNPGSGRHCDTATMLQSVREPWEVHGQQARPQATPRLYCRLHSRKAPLGSSLQVLKSHSLCLREASLPG